MCSGWIAVPVHSRHEEIHPCVTAGHDSALYQGSRFKVLVYLSHTQSYRV